MEIPYETKSAEEIKDLSDKLQRKFCYDYWQKSRKEKWEQKENPKDKEELKDVEDIETIIHNPIKNLRSVYSEALQKYLEQIPEEEEKEITLFGGYKFTPWLYRSYFEKQTFEPCFTYYFDKNMQSAIDYIFTNS